MIESIYYVISFLCHRQCPHCYEERFRPYRGGELTAVLSEAQKNFPKIIEHFPEHMRFLCPEAAGPDGKVPEMQGRIIVAGGEVLVPQVREPILYPALEQIREKYRSVGGVKMIVQTTGDLVTPSIVDELLERGVWMISVSGMDEFHEGMTEQRQKQLTANLTEMFTTAGMHPSRPKSVEREWEEENGPVFSFFGATPESWIGKIWPRGRAWQNDLSKATLANNFCNAWSGGLNFLNIGHAGSEVSVDPNGNVYPCCMKTKFPIGNLVEEPLMDILKSLVGHPVYEAIAMGHPERMGIRHGWTMEYFLEQSRTITPGGRSYQNLCIGCDRFHEKVLGPVLAGVRRERFARKGAV